MTTPKSNGTESLWGACLAYRFPRNILRVSDTIGLVRHLGTKYHEQSITLGLSDQPIQSNFQDAKGNTIGFYPLGDLNVAKNISQ